jgi:protein SCO1/2
MQPSEPQLQARSVAWAIGALLAVLALAIGAAWLLLAHWRMPLGGPSDGVRAPRLPAPMLETAPQPSRQAYLAAKQRRLTSTGWDDAARGIAHIPLETAMSSMVSGDAKPAPSAVPDAGMHPQVGAALPKGLPFVDEANRPVQLGDFFDGRRPIVLVLGYARCQTLCGTLQQSILQALALTRRDPDTFRLLSVSIDPHETAAEAGRHQDALLRAVGWAGQRTTIHALAGSPSSIDALTRAVGYTSVASDAHGLVDTSQGAAPAQYAHPIGFMVLSPDGHIARYIDTLQVDPRQLAQALDEARSPEPPPPSASLRFLRCLHVDALASPRAEAVMTGVRATGVLLVLGLSGWLWRLRKPPPSPQQQPPDHVPGGEA